LRNPAEGEAGAFDFARFGCKKSLESFESVIGCGLAIFDEAAVA
jgi:hypothetical protein